MTLYLGIIEFILAFIIMIYFARKFEDHFSYYKILYPDKLDKYSSIMDSLSKFSSINISDIKFKCFLPTFSDRNKKLESNNHQLAIFAKKIVNSILMIYIFSTLFILILIILMLSQKNDIKI